VRSLYEITKGDIVSHKPELHQVWGFFTPLGSATTSLREFISVSPYSSPKRRRTSSHDQRTPISSHHEDSSPKPKVPYITRTSPSPPVLPPSPTSSSFSVISHSNPHPILAQLERKSRFCTQKVHCSTCRKVGTDFPRCGRCGTMWCSRSCRLVGGKRHVCSSRA
jgi:hypothetical protein